LNASLCHKMNKTLNIYDGPSFQFFYLGLIGALFGILFIALKTAVIIGSIILILSIFVFLSIRGTQIDLEHKRIKNYLNIAFIKIGKWKDLASYTRLELVMNHHSKTMNSRGVSNTVQVRSCHLILTNAPKERIELKEFTDYTAAKKMLISLSQQLNIERVDRIELIQNKNKMRTKKRAAVKRN